MSAPRPMAEIFRWFRHRYGVTQEEIAREALGMHPSNLSRRIRNGFTSRDEIVQIDKYMNLDGAFIREFDARGGHLTTLGAQLIGGLDAEAIERSLNRLLWFDTTEHARSTAEMAGAWAEFLDNAIRGSRSPAPRLRPLMARAKLIQAYGLMSSVPTESLQEPIEIAEEVVHGHRYPDVEVLGIMVIFCATRMAGGAVDLGRFERSRALIDHCDPYTAGVYLEESARQRIYLEDTDMDRIRGDLEAGSEQFSKHSKLKDQVARFDDVLGRAEWILLDNPKQGSERMTSVIEHLRAAGHTQCDLLIRALAYGGVISLEADKPEGQNMLIEAYQLASSMGVGYFIDWLERRSDDYGVDLTPLAA